MLKSLPALVCMLLLANSLTELFRFTGSARVPPTRELFSKSLFRTPSAVEHPP